MLTLKFNPAEFFGIALYSSLELQIGMMCACMPAVYQLSKLAVYSIWPTIMESRTSVNGSGAIGGGKTIGSQTIRRPVYDDERSLEASPRRLLHK